MYDNLPVHSFSLYLAMVRGSATGTTGLWDVLIGDVTCMITYLCIVSPCI